jgi:hypothetical protein
MKYTFLFPALLGLALVSCKKDSSGDEDVQTTEQKTALITKQMWVYDNGGLDYDKNGTIDGPLAPENIKPCTIDNNLSFTASGQGTMDEGYTKCNETDPQTLPLNWNFASKDAFLDLGGTGNTGLSGRFKILKLSDTQLSITKDSTNSSGTFTFIVNLKH